jgi:hypothetical protein
LTEAQLKDKKLWAALLEARARGLGFWTDAQHYFKSYIIRNVISLFIRNIEKII